MKKTLYNATAYLSGGFLGVLFLLTDTLGDKFFSRLIIGLGIGGLGITLIILITTLKGADIGKFEEDEIRTAMLAILTFAIISASLLIAGSILLSAYH